ncbi:hypothetical protein LCGC14_0717050 [marine sediment metagenome]|uniref:HNH nuclease domain-containing protein n=1 Tax=marine sediment metagenome TaxID=412755 RepID=A0A0F9QYL1_9ZZZZ|nr:HNH endonuclease [bacterium]
MEFKVCTKCGKEKNVEEFGWQNKFKDYRQSWCKICIKEYTKQWHKDNSEYYKEYQKQYQKANPDKINASAANRRATKRNQTPINANSSDIQCIYRVCDIFNKPGNEVYHVDHIHPISKGGLHHEDNLQILTAEENMKKSNKLNSEYKGLTLKECQKIMGDI